MAPIQNVLRESSEPIEHAIAALRRVLPDFNAQMASARVQKQNVETENFDGDVTPNGFDPMSENTSTSLEAEANAFLTINTMIFFLGETIESIIFALFDESVLEQPIPEKLEGFASNSENDPASNTIVDRPNDLISESKPTSQGQAERSLKLLKSRPDTTIHHPFRSLKDFFKDSLGHLPPHAHLRKRHRHRPDYYPKKHSTGFSRSPRAFRVKTCSQDRACHSLRLKVVLLGA